MPRKQSLADLLVARLGCALGPTLAGLASLRGGAVVDYLELGPPAWDWEISAQLEADHGFIVVGKTGNGFFGPLRAKLKSSASAAPWIYADRQLLPPEKVGRAADFVSLWCLLPDFFTLHDQSLEELTESHHSFYELNPRMKRAVKPVYAVPGVRGLSPRDAAKLIARVGGLLHPEPAPEPVVGAGDDEGQDFEVTMQRIEEIEAKALAKLRGTRS